MAAIGAIGALVTALGFGIGGGAWGWVVLAAFVITAVSGLAISIDMLALVSAVLLNVWFLISVSAAAAIPSRIDPQPWNQTLSWLIGSAAAIVPTSLFADPGQVRSDLTPGGDPYGPSSGQAEQTDHRVRPDPSRRDRGFGRHRFRTFSA